MVTICCCSCTYLAYLDRVGDMDLTKRMNAGWVIHYVNMILMFFFTAIFFVELIFTIKEILPKGIKIIRDKIRSARNAKRSRKKNSMFPRGEFTLNTQQNEEKKTEAPKNANENEFLSQISQPNRPSKEAIESNKELLEKMMIEDVLGESDGITSKKY